MRFCTYASGSAGNLYTVEAPGAPTLVLEAGIGFRDVQRALAFQLSDVAGVLVSHSHGDHARAVQELTRAGVDVYASEGTFGALWNVDRFIPRHRAHIVVAHQPFSVGPWRVLPFDTVHDAPEPLGFVIQAPDGERLLYATDTAFVPYRFEPLSIIAIEANFSTRILAERLERGDLPPAHYARVLRSHMSIERVLELLKANDLSQLSETVLLHLSAGNSHAVDFADAVRRATGRPVRVADERKPS